MLSQCDVIGAGMPMKIAIINDGLVSPYITEPGLSDQILIPPEVDTVNLTWQAGHETVSGSIVFFFVFSYHDVFLPVMLCPATCVVILHHQSYCP